MTTSHTPDTRAEPVTATLMEFYKDGACGKFDIIDGKFDYQGDLPITDAARLLFDHLATVCNEKWLERAAAKVATPPSAPTAGLRETYRQIAREAVVEHRGPWTDEAKATILSGKGDGYMSHLQDALLAADAIAARAPDPAPMGQGAVENQWLIAHFDDGTKVSVASYSGGGSPEGLFGALSLMEERPDGTTRFRRFRAEADWVNPDDLTFHATPPASGEPSAGASEPTEAEVEAATEAYCMASGQNCLFEHMRAALRAASKAHGRESP